MCATCALVLLFYYKFKKAPMAKPKSYPKHSIGEHIVPFDLVFGLKDTVASTIKKIRNEVSSWPNIEHIFVVDVHGKLLGTVEFSKLLESPPEAKLEDLATEKFTYITEHSHQSNVAKIALKLGVENIPVVDEEGHFVGIIDATQILKILHEEHVEELMKFSGILASEEYLESFRTKFTQAVKGRLPWLILGLVGGIIATIIVEHFELELKKEIALAFFIPVIVYMNDAVGTQTETIFVRFSTLEKVSLKKYLINEIKVAIVIGLTISSLIFLFISAWFQNLTIAFIVGTSMFMGIVRAGKAIYGLKYYPLLVVASIISFFITQEIVGKIITVG